jgi:hypothetical protein
MTHNRSSQITIVEVRLSIAFKFALNNGRFAGFVKPPRASRTCLGAISIVSRYVVAGAMFPPDPMAPEDPRSDPASTGVPFEPATTCDTCGRFGAYRVAGRTLCADCMTGAGSCCPEFGRDAPGTEPDQ